MKRLITIFSLVLFFFGSQVMLQAQNGKIAGKITDKETGEPLLGANVILMGTTMGAATDVNGKYFIIGVPPGQYEMKISSVGYHTLTVEKIRVKSNLTEQMDFQLEPTSVEMPTIQVTAEQKIIQKDITSTRRTITRENMEQLPGIEQTSDIFSLQGGTVLGQAPDLVPLGEGRLEVRDESVKDVHVRGGRGGEILFLVDGIPVTHPLYGGRDVLDLDVNAVEQIELLTGAFNAEYGQAQSGVVNITTRSGSQKYTGGIEVKADHFGDDHYRDLLEADPYQTRYVSMHFGGPEPITSELLPSIGIDVPGDMYLFLSANVNLTNTAYNNGRTRGTTSIFGIEVDERQQNFSNLTGKLSWDISNNHKLTIGYNGSWNDWSAFDWLWKYYPNNMPSYSRKNNNVNLSFKHILSESAYYSLNFGYLGINYKASLDGRNPADFWVITQNDSGYTDSSTIRAPYYDELTGFYAEDGYSAIWRDDETHTLTFKGDFTSQIHEEHLVKAGVEVKWNDLQYIDIQDGGVKLSNYGEYLYHGASESPRPPGPYPQFGQNRWVFDVKPLIGGAYIQDKFEKEFLIINAGVRMDWAYLGTTVDKSEYRDVWAKATGMNPDFELFKYKISPRFGISFPISEVMVVYFSYGHFNQLPEMQYFYRDPYTGGFTGNPNLDYEQTILYEFGATYQLASHWGFDVKSYTKDISQQVGTTRLLPAGGLPVDLYDNIGYGRARGLEFELNKLFSDNYSAKLTYTVQWADGYASSAFEDYRRSLNDFPNPIRERRLDWDVRHQIIFQGTYVTPEIKDISIFGWDFLSGWSLTMLSRFSSGQPYTPGSFDQAELQKLHNTETGPFTTTTDLKIAKSTPIPGGLRLTFMLDIFNVFDVNNTQISYGFNTWTGEPYKYGDVQPGTKVFYDYYTMYRIMDPRQFSTGRYIKFGMKLDF